MISRTEARGQGHSDPETRTEARGQGQCDRKIVCQTQQPQAVSTFQVWDSYLKYMNRRYVPDTNLGSDRWTDERIDGRRSDNHGFKI